MILSAAMQLIFAHEKALVSYIRVLQKSSQFTRAIRKTASAMLSAAMQLTFARQKYYNILKFWKSFPTTVFFIYNMVGVNTL